MSILLVMGESRSMDGEFEMHRGEAVNLPGWEPLLWQNCLTSEFDAASDPG